MRRCIGSLGKNVWFSHGTNDLVPKIVGFFHGKPDEVDDNWGLTPWIGNLHRIAMDTGGQTSMLVLGKNSGPHLVLPNPGMMVNVFGGSIPIFAELFRLVNHYSVSRFIK